VTSFGVSQYVAVCARFPIESTAAELPYDLPDNGGPQRVELTYNGASLYNTFQSVRGMRNYDVGVCHAHMTWVALAASVTGGMLPTFLRMVQQDSGFVSCRPLLRGHRRRPP